MNLPSNLLISLFLNYLQRETNVATIFYRTNNDSAQSALIEKIAANHSLCAVNINNATDSTIYQSWTVVVGKLGEFEFLFATDFASAELGQPY